MNKLPIVKMNSPRLRFREFRDRWNIRKLGDFASITTGKKDANAMVLGGKYRFYTCAKDYYQIDSYAFDTEALLISGNGANVGYIHYFKGKFDAYQRTYVIDRVAENIIFLKYFLDKNLRKRIGAEKNEGNTPYIVLGTLTDMIVRVPTRPEQQKIADFLTAIDGKIASLKKKKELLEKYKKGVMQAIFSRQIRFRDESGNDYPDWEEKTLREIGKIVTGKTPSTSDKSLWGGEVMFITPTDIIDGVKHQTVCERMVDLDDKSKILPPASVLYTCIASIGKMAITTKPSITNQQINALIPGAKFSNDFIYYSLLWMTPKIQATQSNTTLPIINKTEFSKIKVLLPALDEQKQIASFLALLDGRIELAAEKINQAKRFKKVLLQQMFI